ncbi:class I SAM-dependent methyltransferase [Cellulomonas fimi]|uniref:Methyltransferase type 11 n=1 Tax=Cellulomonas fimi (strain ATCC 484 / DSM 20113 / JCM 1341 / CCUG 24087 / LMG 16345 / NBRC 15513 / NCIMB 8980 / NCTC 7547 / NRS-133) TaxID=590998 RepID=F4H534_CELFA|nr:class I SAM-dependent methyltransferase [Cellulomonas fimi]AEE46640.1 Methyltransferase type 11 [Cellulomonas fimi ATCC 484]NNH08328.1 class I SAM-dependent methyltransferase [Cellulomonas fimi]VEH33745.1 Probable S-adenosylmethionine-dependent methyltransferase MSMEG_2350 [Cellulomonas fimi]
MGEATTIDNDGERMVPELHRPSLMYAEHVTRYVAAAELVRGKRVLDIASGSGYGGHLLAETAASVVGVDVSAQAVAYAQEKFARDNLEFRQGDATQIPLDDASVDVVTTFETIEHVEDYRAFVAEIDRVLAPGGVAIISTPNDLEFIEGNHYHLHEFVYDELLDLVKDRFPHVRPFFQATWKAVAVADEKALASEGPVDLQVTNLAPLERDQYLYFYLVCGREEADADVPVPQLLALGGHWSDRQVQEQDLRLIATMDALHAEIAALAAERDRLAQDVRTITATKSYRVARGASRILGRTRRRPS